MEETMNTTMDQKKPKFRGKKNEESQISFLWIHDRPKL
jgi:hypothetical protein